MATNVPPVQPPAREYREQEVHYLRKTVRFDDVGIAAGVAFGASLPAGALITSTLVLIETAFNAGTTNVLVVGTTAGGNDLVANADAAAGVAGAKRPDTATVKGRLAADTPVFVSYTSTGTAPSAGVATIVFAYVPNNDG